jgi:uncharacterized protein YjbJ (UPF0337 family)
VKRQDSPADLTIICLRRSNGVTTMNKDVAKGTFKQLKGKIKAKWGALTDDEIDQLEGHSEILAGKLQEHYGWELEEAERQVREFKSLHNWH